MAAVVKERYGKRRTNGRQTLREYIITQATDDDDARSALLSECPDTISVDGVDFLMDLDQAEVEEIHTVSADGEDVDSGIYIGSAVWINPWVGFQFQPTGSFQLSFDISGQNVRITQSRATVNAYSIDQPNPDYDPEDPGAEPETIPGTASNFQGAINVQQDGTVEGTEIIVPYFTYTLTKTFSNDTITGGWVHTAAQIVGTVNDGTYHGFAAGELLLYRVSGQQRPGSDENDWDVTFNFAVSYNETSLTVGDMTGIVKNGWDYLWVYYEERSHETYNRVHKVPVHAYVERVYRRTAYSGLAI